MVAAFSKAADNAAPETAPDASSGPAAKVAKKDNISWEEKEMELLCIAVDESQFSNALVDCILVAE